MPQLLTSIFKQIAGPAIVISLSILPALSVMQLLIDPGA